MQFLKSSQQVDSNLPDSGLLEVLLFLLVLGYFVVEIAVVRELHYYAR